MKKEDILAGLLLLGAIAIVVVATLVFGGYGLIVVGTAVACLLSGN